MALDLGRFFRNPETGRVVIVQPPNLPLSIFLVATAVRLAFQPQGNAGAITSAVGRVSLAWWSIDEIVRGDSPFRRVLGAAVLTSLVVGLFVR